MRRPVCESAMIVLACLAMSTCLSPTAGPRLTAAQVVRLADARVRASDYTRLEDFDRSAPNYAPQNQAWYISYDRKDTAGVGAGDFTVQVDDRTKEANVLVFD